MISRVSLLGHRTLYKNYFLSSEVNEQNQKLKFPILTLNLFCFDFFVYICHHYTVISGGYDVILNQSECEISRFLSFTKPHKAIKVKTRWLVDVMNRARISKT